VADPQESVAHLAFAALPHVAEAPLRALLEVAALAVAGLGVALGLVQRVLARRDVSILKAETKMFRTCYIYPSQFKLFVKLFVTLFVKLFVKPDDQKADVDKLGIEGLEPLWLNKNFRETGSCCIEVLTPRLGRWSTQTCKVILG
jgi:hypothetical protein